MARRTTPTDASQVEEADDLEDLVQDKRAGWRADSARPGAGSGVTRIF